jgi:hypothetical protein
VRAWIESLVGCLLLVAGCHSPRYHELCLIVDHNTGFAHFTRGMNAGTIEALRRRVTAADIPVLTEMLRDRDDIVAMTSAQVLIRLGPGGVKAVEVARDELEKSRKNFFRSSEFAMALDDARQRGEP